jgi:hypothetical protein
MLRFSPVLLILALLSACSQLPPSMESLQWADQRGDRGSLVMQRDMAWCMQAIESRRSLLASCMAERGWAVQP